ncbi:MAG: VOC family protein [Rhodobacteraceae bacterium]|nr:VOC family protein [Paracoccaceae bacterium]
MTPQRITMVTLAVRDLDVSRKFYNTLGWQEAGGGNETIAFYQLHGQFMALYSREALTTDIGIPIKLRTTGSITLATNYGSPEEVDAVFQAALKAGATAITDPAKTPWGGYSAMIAGPDGHLWEYAHNPFWDLDENGNVKGDP